MLSAGTCEEHSEGGLPFAGRSRGELATGLEFADALRPANGRVA